MTTVGFQDIQNGVFKLECRDHVKTVGFQEMQKKKKFKLKCRHHVKTVGFLETQNVFF